MSASSSPDLENDLLILVYDLARMIRRKADQVARRHGTTRAQWVVLARLARQPGMCQAELANIAEVEPITMARLIDRLEARGLVERRSDAKDRRLRRLYLTERAEPLLDQVAAFRAELHRATSRGLSRAQLAAVAPVLQHMKSNLNEEWAAQAEERAAAETV